MAENKAGRLSMVQVSRGIAILFVLIGHVNILYYSKFQYDWFYLGRWERTGGVDFFFIVTGFMIYYLYHRHIGVQSKAREFLLKRLIRIYPLLWIFTIVTIIIFSLFPVLGKGYTAEEIIKSLILFPMKEPIISSAWSLSHVMFFYFLFTCLMFSPKIFKPILIGWVSATVLFELLFPDIATFIFSFSTLEIVAGSLVAYLMLNYKLGYSTQMIFIGFAGYLFVWLNNVYDFAALHSPLLYCLFSMLIMLGISIKDRKVRDIPKSLSLMGDASYSIYITHGPFLQLYIFIFQKFQLIGALGYFLSMCLVIFCTVLSGCAVYKLIEKPMSKKLRSMVFGRSKSPKVSPAIAKTS
jgi:peptidoglycan/LPS O-acetylase OafA/YrhL